MDINKECCPQFDPSPWDGKLIEWKDKKFIKDKVFSLFYMPINFGQVITRLMTKVENANGKTLNNVCLSDHTSKWNMDIYLAVNKEIPGAENVTLTGKFFSKVYEGDFRNTGKWCTDFENIVTKKGFKISKWFMWYTTCPKCAKKFGKNYVVIIGKVEKYKK
jgi:hypothetical protein